MNSFKYIITITCVVVLSACSDSENGVEKDDNTLVYTSAQMLQCEEESGFSEQETAQQLIDYGVEVVGSSCGELSNVSFPSVCGGGTGHINLHLVNNADVIDAENIGFSLVSSLINTTDDGYNIVDCD